MWKQLPKKKKDKYKELILAFASLSEIFSQKLEDGEITPIINSKFQETVFQKSFDANAEDIGNTAYDASLIESVNGTKIRYLVGIKTFGFSSGFQKIAQFKANVDEWTSFTEKMFKKQTNSKTTVDDYNKELYMQMAARIATYRNKRIDSAEANAKGFLESDKTEAVYHVLMPHKGEAVISVGETSYDKININSIRVLGCTSAKTPTNFEFSDGKHTYRFTSADSQLLMNFDNSSIIQENWNVKYVEDVYSVFEKLYTDLKKEADIAESYSWLLTNKCGEMEMSSGFNNFYGTGSKLAKEQRSNRISDLVRKYRNQVSEELLSKTEKDLKLFLISSSLSSEEKASLRNKICSYTSENSELNDDIKKLLYRPISEMYIPIPKSREFHENNPDFFGKDIGRAYTEGLTLEKEDRKFSMVFEPSGNHIDCFITQDNGKGIESVNKQSILGEWILRQVFQLDEYEPLTKKKLNEVGINGIRLYKLKNSDDVHLSFIWIDEDHAPSDFISKT